MQKDPCVYILASQKNGTLYVIVTSNLQQRIWQHKSKHVKGFTARYNVTRLAYFEPHVDMGEAIRRERQLKKWYRQWKIDLIEAGNPAWEDLWGRGFDGLD